MTGMAMLRRARKPRSPAPELAGPADPLHALDQLGGDAQRDHDRHPELVEGPGQGTAAPASDWPGRWPPRGSTAGLPRRRPS